MNNKMWILLAAQVGFWVILIALALKDLSLDLFGAHVGLEVLWSLFLIPPLELLSLEPARKAVAPRLKRYLVILQFMGLAFWILNVCFICLLFINR